jgi:hypothetical protein
MGRSRCLFHTPNHNFLGLRPDKIDVGNEFWLLKGAFTAFVLRPQTDGRYIVIGESYVHGIMHGEWLEQPDGSDGFGPIELI